MQPILPGCFVLHGGGKGELLGEFDHPKAPPVESKLSDAERARASGITNQVHSRLCPPAGQVWMDETTHLLRDYSVGWNTSLQGL